MDTLVVTKRSQLTDIANAIRAKTGKSDEITLNDMPNEIKNMSGGSLDIHGVIEQYRVNAGKSVNAGDFVEFVHKFGAGEFTGETSYISACKLDNNRVLVAYSDTTSSRGRAAVLVFSNGLIDFGENIVFYSGVVKMICAVALTGNKVLLTYAGSQDGYYIQSVVLTIDGTTIAKGTALKIRTYSNGYTFYLSTIALSENQALIAYYDYQPSSYYYHRFYLLAIDGETVTNSANAGATLNQTTVYSHNFLVKLTETKALMLYQSQSIGYASVITIGDNSISKGTTYSFNKAKTTYISAAALSDSTVLVAYNDGGNSNYGTANMLSINGTTVSIGTPVIFNSSITNYIQVEALNENTALVVYDGSAQVLTCDGITLSFGSPVIFWEDPAGNSVGTYKSIIPFSESSVLVTGVSNNIGKCVNLQIDGYAITTTEERGTVVQKANSRLYNVGIAATSGTDGETIDVYTVDTSY